MKHMTSYLGMLALAAAAAVPAMAADHVVL